MAIFLYFFLEWIAGITYLVLASFKYWLADGADIQIVTRFEVPFFFLGVVPGVGIVVAEASYFISYPQLKIHSFMYQKQRFSQAVSNEIENKVGSLKPVKKYDLLSRFRWTTEIPFINYIICVFFKDFQFDV